MFEFKDEDKVKILSMESGDVVVGQGFKVEKRDTEYLLYIQNEQTKIVTLRQLMKELESYGTSK